MLRRLVPEVEDFSEPILPGTAPSDYERYLRTDELLALQKTPDELSHRDELLFMTVHQSSELWLKLAGFEVETAVGLLRDGELPGALRLLRRAHDCMKNTIGALDMLEHMSPWEYTAFVRPLLGHGSGFDSPGFREVRRVSPMLGESFTGSAATRASRSSTSTSTAASTRSCTSSPRRSSSGTSASRSGACGTSRSSSGSSARARSAPRARRSSCSGG